MNRPKGMKRTGTIHVFVHVLQLALLIMLFQSCVEPIHPYNGLAPGTWRGVLFIDPNKSVSPGIQDRYGENVNVHEMNDEGILPFLFDVQYDGDSTWHVEIINGEEKLAIRDIQFGRTREDADNHLRIQFPSYDAELSAVVKEDIMQGHFIVHSKANYRIPFAAYYGKNDRFVLPAMPSEPVNLDGRWEVTFSPGETNAYGAVGVFTQKGNSITGTFLTETGDYRYLDGVVIDDKLWLSTFDGAHAFLFHAKLNDANELIGTFRSGKHYETAWIGKRNSEATLTHPDSLTTPVVEHFSLQFPNEKGELITVPQATKEHVQIIQILGTWCPNCKDEVEFLKTYLNDHPDLPIRVTGIAFERYDEEEKALAAIGRYKENMNVPYPILWGGSYKKSIASEKLPMLDQLRSYPTMIILDKQHNIRKVHTGFNGPATEEYDAFQTSFDAFIRGLISE